MKVEQKRVEGEQRRKYLEEENKQEKINTLNHACLEIPVVMKKTRIPILFESGWG